MIVNYIHHIKAHISITKKTKKMKSVPYDVGYYKNINFKKRKNKRLRKKCTNLSESHINNFLKDLDHIIELENKINKMQQSYNKILKLMFAQRNFISKKKMTIFLNAVGRRFQENRQQEVIFFPFTMYNDFNKKYSCHRPLDYLVIPSIHNF